jgi:hypothetical protein
LLTACWSEQNCQTNPDANSSHEADHVPHRMILMAVKVHGLMAKLRQTVACTIHSFINAVSHSPRDTLGLFEQINRCSKNRSQDFLHNAPPFATVDLQLRKGELLGCSSAHYKMQNDRNHSKEKKEMNQATRHMKHRETANPCDHKDNEQNHPHAHFRAPRESPVD